MSYSHATTIHDVAKYYCVRPYRPVLTILMNDNSNRWDSLHRFRRMWEKERELCVYLFIVPFLLSLLILHIPPAYFDIRLDAGLSSLARRFDLFVDQVNSGAGEAEVLAAGTGSSESILDAVARASFEENAVMSGSDEGSEIADLNSECKM